MSRFKVLSTKKLKPLLLQQLNKDGFDITGQEFIATRPIESEAIQKKILELAAVGISDIALTSKQAVEALDRYMHPDDTNYIINWNIFCLSGATKQAVLDAKVLNKNIVAEANKAADLAAEIIRRNVKEIIFFCGNKRRDELPDILREQGITVHEIVVYETLETPVIAAGTFDGVLFFSPSGVQSFFSVNHLSPATVCFAIGDTTAAAIARLTNNKIITSPSPTQEHLLSAVRLYFQNINCYE